MDSTVTVVLNDGTEIHAKTFEEVITTMKLDMWIPPKTREAYMKGFAERTEIYNGNKIVYGDCRSFIKELLRIGAVMKIVEKGVTIFYFGRGGREDDLLRLRKQP